MTIFSLKSKDASEGVTRGWVHHGAGPKNFYTT
jgi:hypothetical protein